MIKQPVNEMDVSVKRLYAIAKSWTKVSVTRQYSYAEWLVSRRERELKDWCEDNITMQWAAWGWQFLLRKYRRSTDIYIKMDLTNGI